MKMPPVEDFGNGKPSGMENITIIHIHYFNPSPRKWTLTGALDSLCALAMSSKTPVESRYNTMEDSEEGDRVPNWEDDVTKGFSFLKF